MTPEALYEKLRHIKVANPLCTYTFERCSFLAPIIEEVEELKRSKNVLILAHSYVHPDIIYGVADHVGDSYGLSQKAREAKEEIILFAGVRFMAETAKILNPDKLVIDPNPNGGCSLAESIDAKEVRELRRQHPDHTFVCYINTTAEVKAECDVCVTSSNALQIIESIPNDKIFFLPDRLMAQNLQARTKKKILYSAGSCYVHEKFDPKEIDTLRLFHPDASVIAHPECSPAIVQKADKIASTTGIIDHIKSSGAGPFIVLTECGIASRLQVEVPEAKIIGGCMLCKYMKSNSLLLIREALKSPRSDQVIEIDRAVQENALACVEAMFDFSGCKTL